MSANDDVVLGSVATAVGFMGIVHMVTDVLTLVGVALNVLLAAGGLYLLWLRMRAKKGPGIT